MDFLGVILSYLFSIQVVECFSKLQICFFSSHVKVNASIWLVWRLQTIQNINIIYTNRIVVRMLIRVIEILSIFHAGHHYFWLFMLR